MSNMSSDGRTAFDDAIRSMEAEITNAGAHLAIDAAARQAYARQIAAASAELRMAAISGRLSWEQAARQAQEMRNVVMGMVRGRSTPIGRSLAEAIKPHGRTMAQLLDARTVKLFGATRRFADLSTAHRNAVYAEVVISAGRSRPEITALMRRLSHAGRGLLFLSVALSVHTVMTAEDKGRAAVREVAVTTGAIGGGMAGGAVAGLACGPGAPICVTLGAFVGGALAAFGVSAFW